MSTNQAVQWKDETFIRLIISLFLDPWTPQNYATSDGRRLFDIMEIRMLEDHTDDNLMFNIQ